MADIFLSYSREDHTRAEQIAKALTAAGYEVFWDVEIPPGKSWADILEEKLAICKAAIVLWSKISTASKWVREEARLAHDRGKLIPVQIDDAPPPFGFGEIQAADLKHWRGDTSDSHWRVLLAAVAAAVARPPSASAAPSAPARPSPLAAMPMPSLAKMLAPGTRGYILAAVGVLALLGAVALRYMPTTPSSPPAPSSPEAPSAPSTAETTPAAPATPASEAPAATPTAPQGLTRNELASYLNSIGYGTKVTTDPAGNTIVKTAAEGVTFSVYFYNCKDDRCPELQFSAGWPMAKPPSAETVNAWNKGRRFARAYLTEDNAALFVEMDMNLTDAQSNAQIDEYLRYWKMLLEAFKKHFGV